MLSIILAIASRMGFSALSVYWKFFRDKGLSTRTIMGFNGFITLPVIPFAIYLLYTKQLAINYVYIFYMLGWMGAIFSTHFLSVYMYKHQVLTTSDSLRTVFATLLALALDILFFKENMPLMILVGCSILFVSALVIQFHRTKNKEISPSKEVLLILLMNLLIGVTSVLEIAFYKAGLESIEHNVISHFAFTTTVMAVLYMLWGGNGVFKAISDKIISIKTTIIATSIILVSLVAYTYAVDALPLIVMVLVRIVGSGIFATFDVKFKEFKLTPKTITALVGILLGLALITIGKMD